MADRDVPAVAQAAADEVGKIVEKYMPADAPPTSEGIAAFRGHSFSRSVTSSIAARRACLR
jgi:hypothetical protein